MGRERSPVVGRVPVEERDRIVADAARVVGERAAARIKIIRQLRERGVLSSPGGGGDDGGGGGAAGSGGGGGGGSGDEADASAVARGARKRGGEGGAGAGAAGAKRREVAGDSEEHAAALVGSLGDIIAGAPPRDLGGRWRRRAQVCGRVSCVWCVWCVCVCVGGGAGVARDALDARTAAAAADRLADLFDGAGVFHFKARVRVCVRVRVLRVCVRGGGVCGGAGFVRTAWGV